MSESGTGLPPTAGDLVWPALNFVLFVALLVRFLREPIREYFRARGERLGRALEAGAQARAAPAALDPRRQERRPGQLQAGSAVRAVDEL